MIDMPSGVHGINGGDAEPTGTVCGSYAGGGCVGHHGSRRRLYLRGASPPHRARRCATGSRSQRQRPRDRPLVGRRFLLLLLLLHRRQRGRCDAVCCPRGAPCLCSVTAPLEGQRCWQAFQIRCGGRKLLLVLLSLVLGRPQCLSGLPCHSESASQRAGAGQASKQCASAHASAFTEHIM